MPKSHFIKIGDMFFESNFMLFQALHWSEHESHQVSYLSTTSSVRSTIVSNLLQTSTVNCYACVDADRWVFFIMSNIYIAYIFFSSQIFNVKYVYFFLSISNIYIYLFQVKFFNDK